MQNAEKSGLHDGGRAGARAPHLDSSKKGRGLCWKNSMSNTDVGSGRLYLARLSYRPAGGAMAMTVRATPTRQEPSAGHTITKDAQPHPQNGTTKDAHVLTCFWASKIGNACTRQRMGGERRWGDDNEASTLHQSVAERRGRGGTHPQPR